MDLLSTSQLFAQFLAQRRYLKNVTSSTIEWYETAFKERERGIDDIDERGTEPSVPWPARCRPPQRAPQSRCHRSQPEPDEKTCGLLRYSNLYQARPVLLNSAALTKSLIGHDA
jgi:hypothetical protein